MNTALTTAKFLCNGGAGIHTYLSRNQQKFMIFTVIHQDLFFKQIIYHKINHLLKGRNIL